MLTLTQMASRLGVPPKTGLRGGIFTTSTPAPASTASNASVN
jgi:hypothetical protein